MRSEWITWAGLVAIMLVAGWLMGRALHPEAAAEAQDPSAFRAWFWERRTFDLLAQVGLIFAGALGVAALLPSRAELQTGNSPDEDRHAPLA